jgi:hypothetical protein
MGACGGEEIWWGNLRERSHLEDLDVDDMGVNSIERVWTSLIWLRIGRSGRLLWT